MFRLLRPRPKPNRPPLLPPDWAGPKNRTPRCARNRHLPTLALPGFHLPEDWLNQSPSQKQEIQSLRGYQMGYPAEGKGCWEVFH